MNQNNNLAEALGTHFCKKCDQPLDNFEIGEEWTYCSECWFAHKMNFGTLQGRDKAKNRKLMRKYGIL